MSRIRGRDTKPELIVRRYLFAHGLRYRVNVSRIPGHPDIVLTRHNALIEVRGCFWHRHPGCKVATTPKSHVRFWKAKFKRNVERDRLHEAQWAEAGWRVFVVWECELRPALREATLRRLYDAIVAPAGQDFSYDGIDLPETASLAAEAPPPPDDAPHPANALKACRRHCGAAKHLLSSAHDQRQGSNRPGSHPRRG